MTASRCRVFDSECGVPGAPAPVSDPGRLPPEPALLEAFRGQACEIVDFDGAIAFRLDYESRFRPRRDRGASAGPEHVVRTARRGLETLPHDLLQTGRRLSFPARRPVQDRAASLLSTARMKLHIPASENRRAPEREPPIASSRA